jgi:dephospho-CoA kinase
MRIIGLTGGIATGKTTVANYLAHTYQLPIFDADIYAREAVAAGTSICQAIATRYGSQILLSDGNLDRQQLGEIIFNDREERAWVEGLIHPQVRDRFLHESQALSVPIVVFVVPLLFETGMTNLVTEIWVVYCSPEQQLQRLIQRNNLTREQAVARISNQLPITEKVARADVVLDNSATLEVLLQQIQVAISPPAV